MLPKCRQAINDAAAAAGRGTPTDAQAQAIENQIAAKMRILGRGDDAARWRTLSRDQQMTEAAGAVIADIQAAAQRRLDNAERQILREDETENRIAALQESFTGTGGHSGSRAEAFKADMVNVNHQIAAERKIAFGSLMKLVEAAGDKTGAGMGQRFLMTAFGAENRAMTADIVREVFRQADGSTGNKVAAAAARAWLDTVDGLRTRFNAAGGDVGRLDYGWVPQPWDTAKVRAGRDAFAQFLLDKVDRTRYLREDGTLMNDEEVFDFLNAAVETLATGGLNKTEPGQFKGTGSRANRGADSRQIHLKDGDAWLAVMERYGRGSLYDAMMGHIGGITRDITLVERYGPDVNGSLRLQMDMVARDTTRDKPVGTLEINPQTYADMLTGKTGAPADETLARTMTTVRNLQTAAKLGSAVVSSITDLGTLAITAGYNRLPYWQLIKDIGSQINPLKGGKEAREFMSAHGMIAESVADSLNRWSGDHLGSNWSGKLGNSIMRWSLLNAWTDGLRQGFTLSMNAGVARMAKKQWGELAEFDRSRLTRAGFTEADWQTLNGVAPTVFKGRELLTPQSILQSGHERANELAAKLFGLIHDESEFAVVNPDMAARAVTTMGGQQAGTVGGEIARTVMQFKAFPITMITRHWARMLEGDHGADGAPLLANRGLYAFALLATSLGLGAIATQEKQILAGKDPIDMSKGRFWAKALAQGGGLGIAGDLFLIDPASNGVDSTATFAKNVLGPTFGSASELVLKNAVENVWQAADGKDTHWEAELVNWTRSNTPGNSLWWVKPMVDHGFMNAINENLSPGYLARVQQRAAKDWGQRYWWAPRDALPQRAPQLEAAL
jgi:hypothetical protein